MYKILKSRQLNKKGIITQGIIKKIQSVIGTKYVGINDALVVFNSSLVFCLLRHVETWYENLVPIET